MLISKDRSSCQAYVDFDGTIMVRDTTDFLLERFALPEWHAVEDEWAAGKIGSRECMARQIELLRVTPEELEAAVDTLEIDPGFEGFLKMCRRNHVGVVIVSDGLDFVIKSVLRKHRLDVPFFANRLVSTGRNRWRLEFPNSRPDCAAKAGHCKCGRTESYAGAASVVVGDGRSDFCIAGKADLVLAKSKLLDECRKSGMPHLAFGKFDEASELLQGWLSVRQLTGHKAAQVPVQA